jgi:hypothetical protein
MQVAIRNSVKSRFARLEPMQVRDLGKPHQKRRLRNYVAGQLDVRVDPFYDFAAVAVNTPTVAANLFSIPQNNQYTITGGATITKTAYHTNMLIPNQLDAPKKMLVKNIALVPRPDMSGDDLNALIGQSLVTFSVLGKEMWQGHGQKLPAGSGGFISGIGTMTAPNSVLSSANGYPTAQNMALITDDVPDIPGYAPPPPITGVLIETQIPFSVSVDPTLTAATVYTTQNSTTTKPGIVSVGWYYWIYLEGIKLVAIT